jgi:hypothetical protein
LGKKYYYVRAGIPFTKVREASMFFLSKKGCRQLRLLCANGQQIPEGWSSTEYNSNNAWKLNMNNGNRNNNNKNNNNYVRPVLAYLMKNSIEAKGYAAGTF